MNKLHLYGLTFVLTMVGAGLFAYKAWVLKFPLVPGETSSLWTVEAQISFETLGKSVKASIYIPRNSRDYSVVNENFLSRGFGLSTKLDGGNRKATWSIRKSKGKQHLFYRAVIRKTSGETSALSAAAGKPDTAKANLQGTRLEAALALIAEIYEKSADTDSFVTELLKRLNAQHPEEHVRLLLSKLTTQETKIQMAVDILAQADIPARAVHGIRLDKNMREAPLIHWLEVYENGVWRNYEFKSGERGIPDDYLAWWRGAAPLLKSRGIKNPKITFSVVVNQEEALFSAIDQSREQLPFLIKFSLFGLPLRTQAVYRILLLVPVGALLITLLRNVVGVRTVGTFMPILIALAFRETQLLWGLALFSIILAVGLSIRLYFEHLKLLVVPRLASVLIVVILIMASFSVLTHQLGLERGLSIALFPMVILTMAIERMSVVWEELGVLEALRQGTGTLLTAALIYTVMTITYIEHLMFVFPELCLILLSATLLLGRYSGYRLMELLRFKAMTETGKHV